jgi:hypothetical protein
VAKVGVTDDAALFSLTAGIVGHANRRTYCTPGLVHMGRRAHSRLCFVVEPMNLAERAHRSSRVATTSSEVHRGRA